MKHFIQAQVSLSMRQHQPIKKNCKTRDSSGRF